jgi:pyruvate kinase
MTIRRTKIVCTIGPACRDEATLREMLRAGMDVARLNFSHEERATFAPIIARLRAVAREVGRPLAILQDLQGPKIRVGPLAGGPVELVSGQHITITVREVPGDAACVSTTYAALPLDARVGATVLLDDGMIELKVAQVTDLDVACEVVVGGLLKPHKGINMPGVPIRAPALTLKDRDDLAFGVAHGVDYVALSFVRHAEDIAEARRLIQAQGADTPIIAKIERFEALENLDAILTAADGVMVARGDLGVETSSAEVPLLQKRIIRRSSELGKIDITATQMLESMIQNPRPTRAEACDVANAVFDGTDAVMLSGETAVGRYPVQTVRTLADIAAHAETEMPQYGRTGGCSGGATGSILHATACAACLAARELDARAIVCLTRSGRTAVVVSQQRPESPILALTPDPATYRRLALPWGVMPMRIEDVPDADGLVPAAQKALAASGLVASGDTVVLIAGGSVAAGATNTVRILKHP